MFIKYFQNESYVDYRSHKVSQHDKLVAETYNYFPDLQQSTFPATQVP